MDWDAHWRFAARQKGRPNFPQELANEFRKYVGDSLDDWRGDWESMPNKEVAEWLRNADFRTFFGKRFDHDAVRDFKRALLKNDPRLSTAIKRQESEAIAILDRARREVLTIIPELDGVVPAERANEIEQTLHRLTLMFCEDRFASQVALSEAVDVAARKFEKRFSRPLFLEK